MPRLASPLLACLWAVCLVTACGGDEKRFVEATNEGVQALRDDNPAKARAAFHQALTLRPDDAEVNFYLGTLDLREDKAVEAVERLQVATKADPKWPDAQLNLAKALAATQRRKPALDVLQALFALDPGHPQGHLLAGRIALEVGDRGRADEQWRAAIAGDPGFWPAYVELAHLYAQADAHEAARQICEEGLKFAPDAGELNEALGLTWMDLGRPDRAQQAFEKATHAASVRYQLYLNLAAAALQAGDRTAAEQALRTYVGQAQGRKPDAQEVAAASRMLAHLQTQGPSRP